MKLKQYTLKELTHGLDVEIKGSPGTIITGVAPIQAAQSGHITFLNNTTLNNSAYRKYLQDTQASVVILNEEESANYLGTAVISQNPYFVYAQIARFFDPNQRRVPGIHKSAVVGERCNIDPSASIGAHCVIGDDVNIGSGTVIDANVTIYHHVVIGSNTHIASGAVIGGDGFGYANNKGAWHKVPQLGGVVIGDDVEIGSNTTIDRGAIEDTVIGNGVKLDNLIQIGHNVKIGDHTIIAGCVAISGSVTIGKYCMVGGASCFAGHITIADGVMITGMTAVTKSILERGMYSSGIVGAVPSHEFRKNNARFHRLENLMDRVKTLEQALKEMTKREAV